MTFTFDSSNPDATLTFNTPNGPSIAYLQLWSQMANQQLVGNTQDPLDYWNTSSQGLVLELVFANDRYSEYKFKYYGTDGIDDFDQIFTKDVAGIYNYKLQEFTSQFIWNLDNNLWNLEPSLWSQPGNFIETPLEIGMLKVKNVEPTSYPQKATYISSNETRQGYVYLTNNSL
jgi:hypothetical protein